MKRKDLLSLPVREWNKTSQYDGVCIVPTGKKHDSGWALMAIVGMNNHEPVEIAAYCDDLIWHGEEMFFAHGMRTDMYYPSGIARMWGDAVVFEVGEALSSTSIKIKSTLKLHQKETLKNIIRERQEDEVPQTVKTTTKITLKIGT